MKFLKLLLLFLLGQSILLAQVPSYINMDASSKWKQSMDGTTRIKVSWENPSPDNYEERELVRRAIEDSWGESANISFYGWGESTDGVSGIRIHINNYGHPHVDALGSRLDGRPYGMELNFEFRGEFKCYSNRNHCISAIAIHEFGHALGFAHEHNRADCRCDKEPQGSYGGLFVTPCDANSVMNYCSDEWNNGGELSHLDIEGVQSIYGAPYSPPTASGIEIELEDVLGSNQVWENLYLEIDGTQFVFNVNKGNVKEVKSAVFERTGNYKYYVSSMSKYSDGIIYKGKGEGQIYLESGKSYTLALYQKSGSKRGNRYGITLVAEEK